jgi:hypothetical protein
MSLEASDLNVSSFSRAFSSLYKTKQKVTGQLLEPVGKLNYIMIGNVEELLWLNFRRLFDYALFLIVNGGGG